MKQLFFFIPILFLGIVLYIFSSPQKAIFIFSRQGKIDLQKLTGVFEKQKNKAFFNNNDVSKQLVQILETESKGPVILGDTNEPKRIEIDLTNQRLYAYQGEKKIFDFLISTGKWGRTPTGNFKIWSKSRYTLMTGGSSILGTYYYLPNVPYTMFFYNNETSKTMGYGIHGTYWHNNFGHPMSHGSINMKNKNVKLLYYWTQPSLKGGNSVDATDNNPGTDIVIYGEAPFE